MLKDRERENKDDLYDFQRMALGVLTVDRINNGDMRERFINCKEKPKVF